MNYGPLLFLAAFFALASSWFGFVLTPQIQLGRMQQTNSVPAGDTYPVARPGRARQGLDVYRANGCAYCHSQQTGQTGTVCDVLLTDAGTNQTLLLSALLKLNLSEPASLLTGLPRTIQKDLTKTAADAVAKTLNVGGAKAEVWIRPTGPDIDRGWGKRRSVAEDFLYDYPVMPGSQRIGPDLANVGTRLPDANWHLLHLYSPTTKVPGSAMPPYRFLFETRRIERSRSPEALPAEFSPDAEHEIIPRPEAKALVAYLLSLHANTPLFDAPLTLPPPAPAATNAPPK
jgi:cbb3-type cytochrome oxidase cytochrome c subunit